MSTSSIEYPLSKEPIKFEMVATLAKAAATPKDQDEWTCAITSDYPGLMVLVYRMGVGHRKGYKHGRLSAYDWERTRPVAPVIRDVLSCIGMDFITAEDMPRDEASAIDHLAAEFGPSEKASDALRMVRALNKQADDLRSLLRHTGIDPRHFADWAQGLDQ
jgi:hypothetical protein